VPELCRQLHYYRVINLVGTLPVARAGGNALPLNFSLFVIFFISENFRAKVQSLGLKCSIFEEFREKMKF